MANFELLSKTEIKLPMTAGNMIIDCIKCRENDFTLRLTKKMKVQCICNNCGESFKLKLAKKHRVIRWVESEDENVFI